MRRAVVKRNRSNKAGARAGLLGAQPAPAQLLCAAGETLGASGALFGLALLLTAAQIRLRRPLSFRGAE